MPIGIRITHLILVIQPIRPKVVPTTGNLGITPIKRLQQRRRRRPVVRSATVFPRGRRAHAKGMRNLMQRRPFRHVGPVRPKADVAVAAAVRGRHARVVLDRDGFGRLGALGLVPCNGGVHGRGYLCVGIGLVIGGTGGFLEGVCELCGGQARGSESEEDPGKVHVGFFG